MKEVKRGDIYYIVSNYQEEGNEQRAFRINAWSSIYDFLESKELTDEILLTLYEKCNGHIIAVLVDEYIYDECCDIAQYSDLKELVENILNCIE